MRKQILVILIIVVILMMVTLGLLWAGCGDEAADTVDDRQSRLADCGDEIVVTVNDRQFTCADLNRAIAARKVTAGEESVPADKSSPEYIDFEKNTVKNLALNYILGEEAKKMGITVSDAEVDNVLKQFTGGDNGEQKLNQRLDSYGISMDELKDSLRTDLTFQRVFNEIVSKAPPVTDEEALAYYEQHRSEDDFLKPETRNIHMIYFSTEVFANQAATRLDAGEDFVTVGREMSADPAKNIRLEERTAVPVVESGLPPEAEKAMAQLPVGQVSDPVKSGFGYYIIRVNSTNPREAVAFDEIREQLKQQLQMTGVYRQYFDAWLAGVVPTYNITYNEKYQPAAPASQ